MLTFSFGTISFGTILKNLQVLWHKVTKRCNMLSEKLSINYYQTNAYCVFKGRLNREKFTPFFQLFAADRK